MNIKVFNALSVKNICVFQAVAEHGSLTRAAKLLNRSQGQLSSIVKDIEAVCGTGLLLRTPSGIVLTEAGEAFLLASRTYIDAYHDFLHNVEQLVGRELNQVVLYAPPGVIQFLAEHVVHHLGVAYPDISLVMKACPLGEFDNYDHLLNEAGIVISLQPSSHPDAVNCRVEQEMAFFASPAYRPSTRLIHPKDLSSEQSITVGNYGVGSNEWVYREDNDDKLMHVSGKYQTNDVLSALSMAKKGLGVIFIPTVIANACVDDGSLVRVIPTYHGRKS